MEAGGNAGGGVIGGFRRDSFGRQAGMNAIIDAVRADDSVMRAVAEAKAQALVEVTQTDAPEAASEASD